MKKEERSIYFDTNLQVEIYEFKGISQKFNAHFHEQKASGHYNPKFLVIPFKKII